MSDSIRNALVKANRAVHRVMLYVADVSLILMIAIVTLTVVLRYCFNTGLSWAEEVPRLLVTLFAFLACAMGVRDHMHVSVSVVYNLFPKGGKMRRFMEILTDVCILICGLFMLYYGAQRTIKLFGMSGTLPITGWNTAWQYLPVPLAGFVMSMDSIFFLSGVLKPDDLLYSEPDVDYTQSVIHDRKNAKGGVR